MVIAFQKGKQTCLLYLASILVDVFAEIPDCLPGLIGLFEVISRLFIYLFFHILYLTLLKLLSQMDAFFTSIHR